MRKNIYFLVLLFVCSIFTAKSQNVTFTKSNFPNKKKELKDVIKAIEKGDEYYILGRSGMYKAALDYYLKANRFNPNNTVLNYKIGKCYLNSVEKIKAIPYLEKALDIDPNKNIIKNDIHFMLARAYHLNLDFDKAISEYNKYRKTLVQNDEYLNKKINKHIQECKVGKTLVENPSRAFIDLIPLINTEYPDYSPIVNADESVLFFTSRRPENIGGNKDPFDLQYYEDVYYTRNRNRDVANWSAPKNLDKPINSKEHDAIVGLSPDGQRLFLYKGVNGGDIYECELEGNEWSKPKALGYPINTEFHESSAAFSYDGRTVYFVSDRDGGHGMHDIYMVQRKSATKWGEPKNLGPTINTEYDEKGVFMTADGKTLYFSSQGHNTMGGFDIFMTQQKDDGSWTKPKNLSYPINSPDNDIFFSIAANGKHGYYSSVKSTGKGDKDIYRITFIGPEKQIVMNSEFNLLASRANPVSENVIEQAVDIKAAPVTILKGKITDERTNAPIKAQIELIDNKKNKVLAVFSSNSSTGNYLVSLPAGKNYGISIKAEDYLFHSENFNIPKESQYSEVVKDIQLKKAVVGSKIVLRNIFFDVGKAKLRTESYAELGVLRNLLKNNPNLKIEISGHTDNTGSASLNQRLSERRAKAVVDFLVKQGISKDRLKYAGYGETQPIADNNTREGRQMNRRTEFKVLSNED